MGKVWQGRCFTDITNPERRICMANPLFSAHCNLASFVHAETTVAGLVPTVVANATFAVGATMMTSAEFVTLCDNHEAAVVAAEAAHTAWLRATEAQQALRTEVIAGAVGLRSYVAATYGTKSVQYASLGFVAAKPAKPSAETKAEAVVKRAVTRGLRDTKGKRQKEASHTDETTTTAPATPNVAVKKPTGSGS
jgi:hypothetical protein